MPLTCVTKFFRGRNLVRGLHQLVPVGQQSWQYPFRHPEIKHEPSTTDLSNYFRLTFCTVVPPPWLPHHVLPYRLGENSPFIYAAHVWSKGSTNLFTTKPLSAPTAITGALRATKSHVDGPPPHPSPQNLGVLAQKTRAVSQLFQHVAPCQGRSQWEACRVRHASPM